MCYEHLVVDNSNVYRILGTVMINFISSLQILLKTAIYLLHLNTVSKCLTVRRTMQHGKVSVTE